jgi:hypothetical protein
MKILELLQERLANFEKKELYRFSLIYLAICIFAGVGIVAYYIYSIQDIKSKIIVLNKTRGSVQSILTQYQVVKRQKNKVDEVLKQNKNFNILKFFDELLQKYHIAAAHKFTTQKLPNGYQEDTIQMNMSNIDTKTMCELLSDIEQQSILYINSIDISKQNFAKKINLTLSVATLRPEE